MGMQTGHGLIFLFLVEANHPHVCVCVCGCNYTGEQGVRCRHTIQLLPKSAANACECFAKCQDACADANW